MFERIAKDFETKKSQSPSLLRSRLTELLDLLDIEYWMIKFANRRIKIANRRVNFANRRIKNTSYWECASIFLAPGVCTYYCTHRQKIMFLSHLTAA